MENVDLRQDDDEEPDSAENIEEVQVHQTSQIKTPKQISDMGTAKKNLMKTAVKSKPSQLASGSKSGFSNIGPLSASKKDMVKDLPKAGATRNQAPTKKETKYMAISFNDSA